MDKHGIAIRFGNFHSRRLIESLSEAGNTGVLHVSMVHYNTLEQVDRIIDTLGDASS